jgi:hypothetical protein
LSAITGGALPVRMCGSTKRLGTLFVSAERRQGMFTPEELEEIRKADAEMDTERKREIDRRYYANHRERIIERNTRYYQANRERILANRRARYDAT